ncbi:hypothetical protein D9M71_828060 [compost metagenome]
MQLLPHSPIHISELVSKKQDAEIGVQSNDISPRLMITVDLVNQAALIRMLAYPNL